MVTIVRLLVLQVVLGPRRVAGVELEPVERSLPGPATSLPLPVKRGAAAARLLII